MSMINFSASSLPSNIYKGRSESAVHEQSFNIQSDKNKVYIVVEEKVQPSTTTFDARGEEVQAGFTIAKRSAPSLSDNTSLAGTNLQNYKERLISEGNKQETKAIIRLDGKVVAYTAHDGVTTSRNSFDTSPLRNGVSQDQFLANLKAEYGSRINIETFKSGSGPTNAEVFELFNGMSYSDHIDKSYQTNMRDLAAQLEARSKYQAQVEQYNAIKQEAVFTINGTIVGSTSNDGSFTLQIRNLTEYIKETAPDSDLVERMHYKEAGETTSIEEIKNMLSEVFGDEVGVHYFSEENQPSRAEINKAAQIQYRDLSSSNDSRSTVNLSV